MRKKTVIWMVTIVIALAGIFLIWEKDDSDVCVTRAQAAKTLALLCHSQEECLTVVSMEEDKDMGAGAVNMESTADTGDVNTDADVNSSIVDVDSDMSFYPYIKTVILDDLMQCDGDFFYPMKMLTYGDFKYICQKMSVDDSELSADFNKVSDDDFVTAVHWCEFVTAYNAQNPVLEQKQIRLLGTSATMSELESWTCSTDAGVLGFRGLSLDGFTGQTLNVFIRDNEIVQVIEVLDNETDENDLIHKVAEENRNADRGLHGGADKDSNDSGNADRLATVTCPEKDNVRVLLNTDGFAGIIHGQVAVTSDSDFKVVYGGQEESYSAGETIEFTTEDSRFDEATQSGNGAIVINTTAGDGTIQILSLNRQCGHPQYRGTLELTRQDSGIAVINEVSVEEYLYGVLPSEMPVSYGLEALKVQAVCARSFVYTSLLGSSKFADYGADVDDSTSSQVYMNLGEYEVANEAVDATKNQVLCLDDDIVRTYFFSTSCGVTSDVSDVWGGSAQSYLVPVFQTTGNRQEDLALEENFKSFIDLDDGQMYYENGQSWFRWTVNIDDAAIRDGFAKVGESYREGTVGGDITGISILERGKSGIAKTVEIQSEAGNGTVYGEYSIRVALSVSGKTIYCDDGSEVNSQTMLPSAYFYVQSSSEDGFVLRGGGFGHGVGLSQNGAAAMCQSGMDYVQVLKHFFAGTELKVVEK